MKKTRYTNEQIVTILRDADAHGAEAAAKKSGVSVASIYAWRKRFGAMDVSDVKRLRELEAENAKAARAQLRAQSVHAKAKMDELKSAGEDRWDAMVAEMEKVRDAFVHSFSYFKSQV